MGASPLFYWANMSASSVIERVTEIASRVASYEGMELVEVEWKGAGNNRILRIYIDKPGGVTLADCETVSHQVGTILDVEDVIAARYTLEVSSPGLDRKLLKESDYRRFTGKKVKVRLRDPIDGRSHFVGRLAGFEQGQAALDVEGGPQIRFSLENVVTARLMMEL